MHVDFDHAEVRRFDPTLLMVLTTVAVIAVFAGIETAEMERAGSGITFNPPPGG